MEINKFNTRELVKEDTENNLHKYCRDVDYYIRREMELEESTRYVKYWYRGKELKE